MHEEYFAQALEWVKKHGFDNIKSVHEDYESPGTFNWSEDENGLVPHITGLRTGGKSYIELALKDENVQRRVSKWKLLSTLAARKGGKLYLLAPRGHKAFAEKLVEEYNLSAEIKGL